MAVHKVRIAKLEHRSYVQRRTPLDYVLSQASAMMRQSGVTEEQAYRRAQQFVLT